MIKAQAEIKAAAAAAAAKEAKKKKKHPPNNNGPREKYRKIEGEEGGAADLLAESVPQRAPAKEVEEVKVQAPAEVAVEAPVVAAPVKRSKPKVVKF
jgi:hypothetical protein